MKIINKKAALLAVALMSASLQAIYQTGSTDEVHTLPYNENNNEMHILPYDENNEVRIQPYEGETGAIALPYKKNEVKTLPYNNTPTGYQAPTPGTQAGVGYKANGTQAGVGYKANGEVRSLPYNPEVQKK